MASGTCTNKSILRTNREEPRYLLYVCEALLKVLPYRFLPLPFPFIQIENELTVGVPDVNNNGNYPLLFVALSLKQDEIIPRQCLEKLSLHRMISTVNQFSQFLLLFPPSLLFQPVIIIFLTNFIKSGGGGE